MPKQGQQLSFEKCTLCRKDKQKCEPVDRVWPDQKCNQCASKGWPCSENVRAGAQQPIKLSAPDNNNGFDDVAGEFHQYMELSARTHVMASSYHIGSFHSFPDYLNEVYHARYQTLRGEVLPILRLERSCILNSINTLVQTSSNSMLKFAVLCLLQDLLLGMADDKDDAFLGVVLPQLLGLARQVGNIGAAVTIQAFLLRYRLTGVISPLRFITDSYYVDRQALMTRAGAGGDSLLVPLMATKGNLSRHLTATVSLHPSIDNIHTGHIVDIFRRSALQFHLSQVNSEPLLRAWTPEIQEDICSLLQQADIDAQDAFGRTSLHVACEKGFDKAAAFLVSRGARIALRDSAGRTPLHWGVIRSCKTFLSSLADSNGGSLRCLLHLADNDGETPLSLAVSLWSIEILTPLHRIWRGHLHEKCTEEDSWGVLHISAARREPIPEPLIDILRLGPIDCPTRHGRTPLSLAAEMGNSAVVEQLLWFTTIDCNSQDILGRTPLSWASSKGQGKVVKILLGHTYISGARRADPNKEDHQGWTPLHYAVARSHYDSVRLLISADGVDLDKQTKDGETVFAKARILKDGGAMLRLFEQSIKITSPTAPGPSSAPTTENALISIPVGSPPSSSLYFHLDGTTTTQKGDGKRRLGESASSLSSQGSHGTRGHRRPVHVRWPASASTTSGLSSLESRASVSKLEASYMRNFHCCGETFPTMHDLLRHNDDIHPDDIHADDQSRQLSGDHNKKEVSHASNGLAEADELDDIKELVEFE